MGLFFGKCQNRREYFSWFIGFLRRKRTEFTDTAIAGDIVPFDLSGGECACISYTLTLSEQPARNITTKEIDELLYAPKTDATLFGICSLFKMGETKKAWEQLYKILPVTHDFISTSPFVMPNSYAENPEIGIDGESMSDWFTGSGCVLLKVLLWYIVGIRANLKEVWIQPIEYMPFEKLSLCICIKNKKHNISYEKHGEMYTLFIDGVPKTITDSEKISL